jgi:hypothetical protein
VALERHSDNVVPALFARVYDVKEQLRTLAASALEALPYNFAPEVLVSGLLRGLQDNKAPKVKASVLDYYSATVAKQEPACWTLAAWHGPALRSFIAAALALATDKNADVRRAALCAGAAAHTAGEAHARLVASALSTLPLDQGTAVQKALMALLEEGSRQESEDSGSNAASDTGVLESAGFHAPSSPGLVLAVKHAEDEKPQAIAIDVAAYAVPVDKLQVQDIPMSPLSTEDEAALTPTLRALVAWPTRKRRHG